MQQERREMDKYIAIIKKSSLFHNFSDEEILKVLYNTNAKVASYKKGENIYRANDKIYEFGIMLSGKGIIQKVDFEGNMNILSTINPTELFAEGFVYAGMPKILVNVVSEEDSEVLFIHKNEIVNLEMSLYRKLNENMLSVLARKLVYLNKKVDVLTKISIREKILTYLNTFHDFNENKIVELPYNREQLADFLCVNRPSLSRELSAMKKEGIIDFHKNTFKLLIK